MATRRPTVKRTPKLIASASAYIDPMGADSMISYKVIQGTCYLWGSVQLSDCNRKIEWYFSHRTPLGKIDVAINMLTEFRHSLEMARLAASAAKRKRKSVNK